MKNTPPSLSLRSTQLLAAVLAVGVTAMQLVGVDALAQHRSLSSHARVFQLERVVVTASRVAAIQPLVGRCEATTRTVC